MPHNRSTISAGPAVTPAEVRWRQLYLGIAFTGIAVLLLAKTWHRLLAAAMPASAASFAASFAWIAAPVGCLFGHLLATRVISRAQGNPNDNPSVSRRIFYRWLGAASLSAGTLVIAGLTVMLLRQRTTASLAIPLSAGALMFAAAGTAVTLAIREGSQRIAQSYAFFLIGGAGGILLSVPFLKTFGGSNSVVAAGVFFAAASAIWFHQMGSAGWRAICVTLSLGLVLFMVVNGRTHILDIAPYGDTPESVEEFAIWNSYSRVAVTNTVGHLGTPPLLRLDSDSFTPLAVAGRDIPTSDLDTISFRIHPNARVLILGAEGGVGVASALEVGSSDITVIEENALIANTVLRERFADQNARLLNRTGVSVQVTSPRIFLARDTRLYDVVLVAAGSDWLRTREAVAACRARLTPDGVLAAHFPAALGDSVAWAYGRESRREMDPRGSSFLLHKPSGNTMVLASAMQLSDEVLEKSIPGEIQIQSILPSELEDDSLPPDNRATENSNSGREMPTLVILTIPILAFAIWAAGGLGAATTAREVPAIGSLLFLLCAGLSQIAVPWIAIRQTSLIFSNPTHVTTIAIPTVLLAAAAGASWAERITLGQRRSVVVPVVLASVTCVLGLLSDYIIHQALVLSEAARIGTAMLILAPPAFLLGMALPWGAQAFSSTQTEVAANWSLFVAAAITGLTLAERLAPNFGYQACFVIGCGMMLLAGAVGFALRRTARSIRL